MKLLERFAARQAARMILCYIIISAIVVRRRGTNHSKSNYRHAGAEQNGKQYCPP